MKKNLVSIIVIVALFGALSVFALAGKKNDANSNANAKDAASAVKICPNTGLRSRSTGRDPNRRSGRRAGISVSATRAKDLTVR